MAREYVLYRMHDNANGLQHWGSSVRTGYTAEQIRDLPQSPIQKRVFFIGGIYDQCDNDIKKNSAQSLLKLLQPFLQKLHIRGTAVSCETPVEFYTLTPNPNQSWNKDHWIKSVAFDRMSPSGIELAHEIFDLNNIPLRHKQHKLATLRMVASNTVFMSFSIGGLCVQHVKEQLTRTLRGHFSEAEASSVINLVRFIPIGPACIIGKTEAKFDFETVGLFLNQDPIIAEAVKPEIWDRLCALSDVRGKGVYEAFEAHVADLVNTGAILDNPNLRGLNLNQALGHKRVHSRALIVHSDIIDGANAAIYHAAHGNVHSRNIDFSHKPLGHHDFRQYSNISIAYRLDPERVMLQHQRNGISHLLPAIFEAALHGSNFVDTVQARVSDKGQRQYSIEVAKYEERVKASMPTDPATYLGK